MLLTLLAANKFHLAKITSAIIITSLYSIDIYYTSKHFRKWGWEVAKSPILNESYTIIASHHKPSSSKNSFFSSRIIQFRLPHITIIVVVAFFPSWSSKSKSILMMGEGLLVSLLLWVYETVVDLINGQFK